MPLLGWMTPRCRNSRLVFRDIAAQQLHEVHLPRACVHVLQVAILRGIGVRDALRQRFARGQRQHDEQRDERLHGFLSSMCMSNGPSV